MFFSKQILFFMPRKPHGSFSSLGMNGHPYNLEVSVVKVGLTTFAEFESPRKNTRAEIALDISYSAVASEEKCDFELRYVVRERRTKSDWRYGSDLSVDTRQSAHAVPGHGPTGRLQASREDGTPRPESCRDSVRGYRDDRSSRRTGPLLVCGRQGREIRVQSASVRGGFSIGRGYHYR